MGSFASALIYLAYISEVHLYYSMYQFFSMTKLYFIVWLYHNCSFISW